MPSTRLVLTTEQRTELETRARSPAVLALRANWRSPWWRVGITYALLMVFLGPGVWGGVPGAVSRVVLPMTCAFNLLLPRNRAFWPLAIIGNLRDRLLEHAYEVLGRHNSFSRTPRSLLWLLPVLCCGIQDRRVGSVSAAGLSGTTSGIALRLRPRPRTYHPFESVCRCCRQ